MPDAMESKFYLKLTVEERLRLIEEILDSVAQAPAGNEPLGPSWPEMQARLHHARNNPADQMSWDEVCAKLGWKP